jgi:hypothetical protein
LFRPKTKFLIWSTKEIRSEPLMQQKVTTQVPEAMLFAK